MADSRTLVEVLLVEDNPGDVGLVREAIGECGLPINLTIASDGEEALKTLAGDFNPALIILDLNLPKVSGLTVLKICQGGRSAIVVFSSSYSDAEIARALRLGAREFIRKPIEFTAYLKTVREMIEKWALRETAGK